MYPVSHAARVAGISPATLRSWERRYEVVTAQRTSGGHRLYDEAALERLRLMRELIGRGMSASRAAERVRATPAPPVAGSPAGLPDVTELARYAEEMDATGLTAVLDGVFAAASVEVAVVDWLMPALSHLGRRWETGAVTIAGEHFVTASVQRRLHALLDAAAMPQGAPVLVGLPADSRHELGPIAFTTLARRVGVPAVYLGAALPPEEWVHAARRTGARGVVIAVAGLDDLAATQQTLTAVGEALPHVRRYLGGAHQEEAHGSARALGHDLADAARRLRDNLAPAPPAAAPVTRPTTEGVSTS